MREQKRLDHRQKNGDDASSECFPKTPAVSGRQQRKEEEQEEWAATSSRNSRKSGD